MVTILQVISRKTVLKKDTNKSLEFQTRSHDNSRQEYDTVQRVLFEDSP